MTYLRIVEVRGLVSLVVRVRLVSVSIMAIFSIVVWAFGSAFEGDCVMTDHKLIRGGSWYADARRVRAAVRFRDPPGVRYDLLGFRICVRRINLP